MIVATQYQISLLKMKSFLKELDILHERDLKDAPKRYHLLLNRYSSQMSQEIENMDLKNINIIQKIPRINNLIIPGEKKFILNMDNEFGFAITEVISSFEK
jgi:septum formation inhibitor-activating ATPase MinD